MKDKNELLTAKESGHFAEKKITRKQAIKKTGLMAASAATMMILMKSQKAQACSDPHKSGHSGGRHGGQGKGNSGPWGSGGQGGGQGKGNSGPWGSGGQGGGQGKGNSGPWG